MPVPDKQIGTDDIAGRAIATVRRWEAGERAGRPCPVCGASGLEIVDKSARPHMAWHALTCHSCGLDEAIATPMSPHPTGQGS